MKFLIVSVLFIFSFSGYGKTLLVSDVDDTIKLAHVKDYGDALKYALDDHSGFMGMNILYSRILKDQPDAKIVYLSKGPAWLVEKNHRSFLSNREFPAGRYIPRTVYDQSVHKLKNIRSLISELKPDKIIFVGDNGEQDADVYHQISQEYADSNIEFFQFIRMVYSKDSFVEKGANIYREQIGFISPIEIALHLEKNFLLSFDSVQEIVDSVVPEILKQNFNETEGLVAIPYFVNCNDFVWQWDDSINQFAPLRKLKYRFAKRCNLNM
ncbi:MAG: phosphatase domain-containing protein [Bdellovibrio sp.]